MKPPLLERIDAAAARWQKKVVVTLNPMCHNNNFEVSVHCAFCEGLSLLINKIIKILLPIISYKPITII
jgi:hypothetical protein